ncbi:helix-turn-helix domain containing protein [Streptomyces sp. NBC_00554]|uniref:helix-turn-helix domain containing protein n=1 Tax=Streptomyces sp. NBC_00554 TaxID=2903661 RepID=UPI00352C8A30|nr:helix-turn-helix domain containing protein [Streptomyces sp. NBC_00554]
MNTEASAPDDEVPVTPQALRARYESGAGVAELVVISGLSHGTVINRLREAGTVMRTSWQTRKLRESGPARQHLAVRLRTLYEQHGATLIELAKAGAGTRRAARRLLIEAGGSPRSAQQTRRVRSVAAISKRRKLALSLRVRYEGGATVPELAKECSYSVATVYRLLRQVGTRMRPKHRHGPASKARKRS